MNYLKNIAISVDQMVNTLCGGNPDETISSRVGKERDANEKFWAKVINKIFFWEKRHTDTSIEDITGRH